MRTNHKDPRNVATQRSSSEEQTLGRRDLLEIERRENPPAHEFEVEVDGLVGESGERRSSTRRVEEGKGAWSQLFDRLQMT